VVDKAKKTPTSADEAVAPEPEKLPIPKEIEAAFTALRDRALAYPEAVEDFPWGHEAYKVRKKTFLWAGRHPDRLSVTVKLPASSAMALSLPFTEPTGYGLGKSGWVSASIPAGPNMPLALLLDWMDESYRAVAPKKLVKLLAEG